MSQDRLPPSEQDLWRANTYHLLTRLLAKPLSHRLVAQLGNIPPIHEESGDDPVALAWSDLGEASRRAKEASVTEEFHALFDVDGGLIKPYASYYLAGEANAKPLELLRSELAGLGVSPKIERPADHAGALCDTMSQLIEHEDPRQIGFFTRHLKSWLPAFFKDLRSASRGDFYRAVGALGEAFVEVERIYLRKIY